MRILVIVFLLVTPIATAEAGSSDLEPVALGSSYMAVCEKIQSCARAEFSLGQIPAEHGPVLDAALNGLCTGVFRSIEGLANYPELEAPGLACAESLLQLGCDDLVGDRQTAACHTLIEQAEQLGLTLN
ncbi:hypothetical protein [Simiduia litorea]|uniref:hypothetical protein n=1 Tax=Simiduia litorea TaxID=1435348 RepID=UPI0036F3DB6C